MTQISLDGREGQVSAWWQGVQVSFAVYDNDPEPLTRLYEVMLTAAKASGAQITFERKVKETL